MTKISEQKRIIELERQIQKMRGVLLVQDKENIGSNKAKGKGFIKSGTQINIRALSVKNEKSPKPKGSKKRKSHSKSRGRSRSKSK